jgi:hypothetical protein
MRSIVNALNNIAIALGNIALALDSGKKDNSIINKSFTSNNSPKATNVTSFPKHVHINRADTYNKRVYDAFTDKGPNPKHHEIMMDDLRKKWPVLFYALSDFAKFQEKENILIDQKNIAKKFSDNKYAEKNALPSNKDIWKK